MSDYTMPYYLLWAGAWVVLVRVLPVVLSRQGAGLPLDTPLILP